MNSPWEILGLDPQSATEKDVKVAYARLIKQYRPDSDPEGFQRVRQAYEVALAMLKNGQRRDPSAEEAAKPSFDDSAPVVASQPAELIEAEVAIGRAREANDNAALAKSISALQDLCQRLKPGRASIQLWQETLHRVTEGKSALVALGVPIPQLIHEMENGSAIITHAVLGHWEGLEQTDNLVEVAEALIASQARLQNREAAIVALRLGVETGFVKPVLSTVLVKFAFPHVDRDARDALIPKIEEQAAIGNLMPGLRKEQQLFWRQRLRNGRQEWDWSCPEANTALDYLARQMPPQWTGFGIVRQVAPQEWFTRLEKEIGRRQGGLMGHFRPTPLARPRPVAQSSKKTGWSGYGWLAFMVISALVRLAGLNSSDRSVAITYPNDPPTRPAYTSTIDPKFFNPVPRIRTSTVPPDLALQQRISKADADMNRFRQDLGVTNTTSTPTNPPLQSGTLTVSAKARADRLRSQDKSMQTWTDSVNDIASQAATDWKAATPDKRKDIDARCRADVYKCLKQLHTSTRNFAMEHHFMEALLFDPATSPNVRAAALARMSETEPVGTLLPQWEDAAALLPRTAHQIAAMAAFYVKNQDSTLLDDERKRLQALANLPH